MELKVPITLRRKDEHLDLCARSPVEHSGSGLLDDVGLVHEALPERSLEEVDLSCSVLGRPLRAPVLVSAMTGGTLRAGGVNRALAAMAARHGFGMGLGSQRPMLDRPELAPTFRVRDVAPEVLRVQAGAPVHVFAGRDYSTCT